MSKLPRYPAHDGRPLDAPTDHELRIAELEDGLRRLASTESFTVAFDAEFAAPATLWDELRARMEFAQSVLADPGDADFDE